MNRYLSEDEKRKIVELHLENNTTVKIAKILNRNVSTIERFLKKNGYSMNYGKKINSKQENEIIDMYKSGKTCKEIYQSFSHI